MKSGKIVAISLGGVLTVLGMLIIAAVLTWSGLNFSRLNTQQYEMKTSRIETALAGVEVINADCDVRVLVSAGDWSQVEYPASQRITHDVVVTGDELSVVQVDTRRWYERIGIFWQNDLTVTVYLPEGQYEKLRVKTASGDVWVEDGFAFDQVKLQSTSGDVTFSGTADKKLTAKSTSGKVSIDHVSGGDVTASSTSGEVLLTAVMANGLTLKTTSGNLALNEIKADTLTANTTSGEVLLEQVDVKGEMGLETVSGNIRFQHLDMAALLIKTVSGDVSGTLLSSKKFITDTVSGSIRVPPSDPEEDTCHIKTTSGDVHITIVD